MSWSRSTATSEHRRGAARRATAGPTRSMHMTGGVDDLDDFAACKITRKEDWVDLYATPYYFGCEADDRMNAVAFGKAQPVRREAQRDLQLRHRAFRRDRHARSAAGGLSSWSRTATSPQDNFRDFTFTNAVQAVGHAEPRTSSRARRWRRKPPRCSGRRNSRCCRTPRSSRMRSCRRGVWPSHRLTAKA